MHPFGDRTKSELARSLGVSPGRISHYITKGMPTTWDDKVNTAQAVAWVRRNVGTYMSKWPDRGRFRLEAVMDLYAGESQMSGHEHCPQAVPVRCL
jgi:hypothetical protein